MNYPPKFVGNLDDSDFRLTPYPSEVRIFGWLGSAVSRDFARPVIRRLGLRGIAGPHHPAIEEAPTFQRILIW